jgi:hypothetical protein
MTPTQFAAISKMDLGRVKTDVFINKNLETTEKRFGVNSSMRQCAGNGRPHRLERISTTNFQCYVTIPDRGSDYDPDSIRSTGRQHYNIYTFDAGDLELLHPSKPLAKQEPVLLNYDLESERKMFD